MDNLAGTGKQHDAVNGMTPTVKFGQNPTGQEGAIPKAGPMEGCVYPSVVKGQTSTPATPPMGAVPSEADLHGDIGGR